MCWNRLSNRLNALERDGTITLLSEQDIREEWELEPTEWLARARRVQKARSNEDKVAILQDLVMDISDSFFEIVRCGRAVTRYFGPLELAKMKKAVAIVVTNVIALGLPDPHLASFLMRLGVVATRFPEFSAILRAYVVHATACCVVCKRLTTSSLFAGWTLCGDARDSPFEKLSVYVTPRRRY